MGLVPRLDGRRLPKEILRAIRIIAERYREPLRQADMAETVGWTRHHFSRRFREFTGLTFQEYLVRVRVHHACQLLREQRGLSVTAIAAVVGLGTLRNLELHLRAKLGMSPSEYRRRFGEREESC